MGAHLLFHTCLVAFVVAPPASDLTNPSVIVPSIGGELAELQEPIDLETLLTEPDAPDDDSKANNAQAAIGEARREAIVRGEPTGKPQITQNNI